MEWIKIFNNRQEALTVLQENKPRLLLIGAKRLCIVLREGKMYAMEEKCPHNGESLSKGSLNYLGEIICPWHGYRFQMTTGRESLERCRDLIIYPVKENEEGVLILV